MDYFVEFPEINLILKKIFVPLLALLRQSRHGDSKVFKTGRCWNVGMYDYVAIKNIYP